MCRPALPLGVVTLKFMLPLLKPKGRRSRCLGAGRRGKEPGRDTRHAAWDVSLTQSVLFMKLGSLLLLVIALFNLPTEAYAQRGGHFALKSRQASVPQSPEVVPGLAEVSIEVGLVENLQVRRVARVPIVLLDADLATQLVEQFKREFPRRRPNPNAGVYLALFSALRRLRDVGGKPDKKDLASLNETETFVKEHTIASAMTDFDGKAMLQAKAGDYFLFCDAGSDVIWHTPVHLNPGKNSVVLDQNNLWRMPPSTTK
jgi:hypothetical protein